MTLSDAEATRVLAAWPSDPDILPASVGVALAAWSSVNLDAIDPAVRALHDDPSRDFSTPVRGFRKAQKCRTLVAFGVAAPSGPTPLPADLRSMIQSSEDDDEEAHPDHEQSVAEQLATLRLELDQAKSTISHMARQQEESGNDASADYEVHDKVTEKIPASFVTHLPLTKKERQRLLREHQGYYSEGTWPKRLAMSESTRNSKEIKSAAKITLTQLAGEMSKFMERNDATTKMCGTAWSRLLDMKDQVEEQLAATPDVTYRADQVLEQLQSIEGCIESAMSLGLDLSVHMRLNVSNRVDKEMGIDHLRVDPTKTASDDFISDDTYKLVEEAAKKKQNLSWAKEGSFTGSKVGYFSSQPPRKSSGGGGYSRGAGGSGGHGRGRGRGKGGGKGGGKGRGKGGKGTDKVND